jgi:hypothetical protein
MKTFDDASRVRSVSAEEKRRKRRLPAQNGPDELPSSEAAPGSLE